MGASFRAERQDDNRGTAMSLETEAVIDRLVARFSRLREPFAEHLSDNWGEVLPHVFMYDIVLHVTDLFLKSRDAPDANDRREAEYELRAILDAIETEFISGTEDVQELIFVSFVESLPNPDEDAAGVRFHLGPVLREEVERYWPFPDDATPNGNGASSSAAPEKT
jgi:hypothetical protein